MPVDPEDLRFILGLKLRTLRRERGLSLKQIAGRAGLSISYLSEIEKGKKYPKPEKLLRLAEAFGVPFDDLVSLRVAEELGPLKEVFASEFVHGFPFEFFGMEPEDLFGLVAHVPQRAAALIRTLLEIGKTYDMQVEHFLLAALRSYQQMHANYFEELEDEAESFRAARGWQGAALDAARLSTELAGRGYKIDRGTLVDHPELGGLRSVFSAGPPPRLWINGRLRPEQQAFVLARELGYLHLELKERAETSSWLKIESFEQLLNNFKASYFAGALLIERERLRADLGALFAAKTWDETAFLALLERYDATPEMLLYRLTELAPRFFGLEEVFFLRFHSVPGSGRYELTKVFNLSKVPVPHGVGLNEHYCRRWPGLRLLATPPATADGSPSIAVQRSRFLDGDAEFFVVSLARPLVLSPRVHSSVTVGFRINDAFRRAVRFWDDPAIPRVEVNLTCERCRLAAAEECSESAAAADLYRRQRAQEAKERALGELLAGSGPVA